MIGRREMADFFPGNEILRLYYCTATASGASRRTGTGDGAPAVLTVAAATNLPRYRPRDSRAGPAWICCADAEPPPPADTGVTSSCSLDAAAAADVDIAVGVAVATSLPDYPLCCRSAVVA